MKININQRKFNFVKDHFDIHVDGIKKFQAKSKLFTFYPKIEIYNLNNSKLLTVQKESNNIHKLKFTLRLSENNFVPIHTNSLISFSIKNSEGVIYFDEQKNNRIGIFFNNDQIGIIDKNKKVVLGADKYFIELQNGIVDEIWIIGFVIAYDCHYNNHRDSLINYDYGNVIINPERKVNPNWKAIE